MKVVLHIGMTKAGSSALQAGLHAMRRQLSDAGVLYPRGRRSHVKHSLLAHDLIPAPRLPRELRRSYVGNLDAMGRDLEAWLLELRTLLKTTCPRVVVLSNEFLFNIGDNGDLGRLNRRLRDLGNAVDIVAYVRRPSDHYLASVQQRLKASHRILAPRPMEYRHRLEAYADRVADLLHVVKYDRSHWPDGDIQRHFVRSFISPALDTSLRPSSDINRSLSAEAMALLAGYRSRIWPNDHNRFTDDTDRLVRTLMSIDVQVGGDRRARLREHIRHAIDQESTDLLWLRDRHGVVFDDVDYDDLRPPQGKHRPPQQIDDICQVDVDRREELTARLLHHLARQQPATSADMIAIGGNLVRRAVGLIRRRHPFAYRGP